MTIQLGENLKRLRRTRELTQEKLAELLGVSAQSVSKWECGDNLPDISLLPHIANFFEVTTDELLGMGAIRDEKRVADAKAKIHALNTQPEGFNVHDQITEIWKDLARDLPYNLEVQMLYAQHIVGFGAYQKPPGTVLELRNQGIKILERVLEKCTEDKIRYQAISILCGVYSDLYDIGSARKYADRLPDADLCREALTAQTTMRAIYKYGKEQGYPEAVTDDYKKIERTAAEELVKPLKDALTAYLSLVRRGLNDYRYWRKNLGLAEGEEYIRLLELDLPLQDLLNLGNANALSFSHSYSAIAGEYVNMGEIDKALDAFDKFIDGYEHYPDEIKGELSQGKIEDGNVTSYRREVSLREMIYDNCLFHPGFAPLREEPRFIAALERLKNSEAYSAEDYSKLRA
ncbi:MAG: helix-turn-helix transcriptional regulator [Oscillospiraceae bacterium]|jgi:transcriptional regulator with XRE-family HTH domain|nr:helix-turn-helix transcriptional regulator [Oscillospiraceae bacterium]